LETGQTKRRILQTYPVPHSTDDWETTLHFTAVPCRFDFPIVHSVLTKINVDGSLNFHRQFPLRNHHRFETYAGSILPNLMQNHPFICIRLEFIMAAIHFQHCDSTLIAWFLINGLASYSSA
jgi:hypothetical protein